MVLENIVNRTAEEALSHSADQAEVFLARTRTRSLYVEDSTVKNMEEKFDMGLSVRAVVGKKVGESSSTIGDIDDSRRCAIEACKKARLSPPDPEFIGFPASGKKSFPSPDTWDREVANLDEEALAREALQIVDSCMEKEGVKVPVGVLRTAEIETEVFNTNGARAAQKNTMVYTHFSSMTTGESPGEGTEEFFSHRLDIPGRRIGRSLWNKATNASSAEEFKGRKQTEVIIPPSQLSEMLMSSVGFAVSAENVNKRRSRWADKIGDRVADKKLNILDDPTDPRGTLSSSHDDEGVPTEKKSIIEDGVLRSYLYDSYNAGLEGISASGNSLRRSVRDSQNLYQNAPSISPINLRVCPGHTSVKEMIEELDDVILVEKFAYPQINPFTGGFGLELRSAHIWESGERRTVKHALLVGNMFEALKNVEMLGDDPTVYGATITPSIAFNGMELVGSP